MTESIGIMLADLCGSILPFYLSEAETEDYPYAVYEYTPNEFRTKDGVYKITADVYIRVYSENPDDAETKAAAIKAVLDAYTDEDENAGQYVLRQQSSSETCMEGVWQIELQYYVRQNY